MNLSNALTLFRLLLVPAFLIALIYDRLSLALAFFVLAGVTDVLDGFAARYFKQQTLLGATMLSVGSIWAASHTALVAWLGRKTRR